MERANDAASAPASRLTRPSVRCGLKGRSSAGSPRGTHSASIARCRAVNSPRGSSSPTQITRGRRRSGKQPAPRIRTLNAGRAAEARSSASWRRFPISPGMSPRNLSVTWMPEADTNRMHSCPGMRRRRATSASISIRISGERSTAMNARNVVKVTGTGMGASCKWEERCPGGPAHRCGCGRDWRGEVRPAFAAL